MALTISAVLMGVLALLGLTLASSAQDQMFFLFGMALCLFGILWIFVLIHRSTASPDRQRPAARDHH